MPFISVKSDSCDIWEVLFIWEVGRDVFHSGFRNCLYGRRDGMFAGTGRFSSQVYMRMFLPEDDFTRDNLQSQHNIVPAKRDGVFI